MRQLTALSIGAALLGFSAASPAQNPSQPCATPELHAFDFWIGEWNVHGANGSVTMHRITWTPNANGGVRQLWESTSAAGDWTVAFDGTYTRQ